MQIKDYNQIDFSKLIRKVDLIIPAQSARLGPPVGPVLGQVKIKVKDFCTLFNEATSKFKPGLPLRVTVFVFKNESFSFLIKPPSTSFLLKNSLKYNKATNLSLLDLYKISLIKQTSLPHLTVQNIFKNVVLSAKLLNIPIKESN